MGSPDASRAVAIAGEVPGLGAAGPKVNEGSAGLGEDNSALKKKDSLQLGIDVLVN